MEKGGLAKPPLPVRHEEQDVFGFRRGWIFGGWGGEERCCCGALWVIMQSPPTLPNPNHHHPPLPKPKPSRCIGLYTLPVLSSQPGRVFQQGTANTPCPPTLTHTYTQKHASCRDEKDIQYRDPNGRILKMPLCGKARGGRIWTTPLGLRQDGGGRWRGRSLPLPLPYVSFSSCFSHAVVQSKNRALGNVA